MRVYDVVGVVTGLPGGLPVGGTAMASVQAAARVCAAHDLVQTRLADMSVALRGGRAFVAQHLLNYTNVDAFVDEMSSK